MPSLDSPSSNGTGSSVQELDRQTTAARRAPEYNLPSINRRRSAARTEHPDVLLDAVVNVEEIKLDVVGLKANVSVLAEVAGLVRLSVGADVSLDRVTLLIKGVEVKALLEVRLDEVRAILDKALTALIENPKIVEVLTKSLVDIAEEVEKMVTPVVEGVVERLVDPVVQGVVGGMVTPVVEGVVRGMAPPGPGGAVGRGDPVRPLPPGGGGAPADPPVQPGRPANAATQQ